MRESHLHSHALVDLDLIIYLVFFVPDKKGLTVACHAEIGPHQRCLLVSGGTGQSRVLQ